MTPPWRIQLISPAVDFIDNRLSTHHPAFVDPPTYFDSTLNRYIVSPQMSSDQMTALNYVSNASSHPGDSRKGDLATASTDQFPTIMEQFITTYPQEPKGRLEKDCSIRSKRSWEEVLEVLQSAAHAYHSKSGAKGTIRRAARFIGDRAIPIKRITSLIPEVDYSRPMIGTLTILLEVS